MQQIEDLKFLVAGELAGKLADGLPFQIDYDDRFWFGIRVRISRRAPAPSSCSC